MSFPTTYCISGVRSHKPQLTADNQSWPLNANKRAPCPGDRHGIFSSKECFKIVKYLGHFPVKIKAKQHFQYKRRADSGLAVPILSK